MKVIRVGFPDEIDRHLIKCGQPLTLTPNSVSTDECFERYFMKDFLAKAIAPVNVVIIYVHARLTPTSFRQTCEGIELLKHLRITEQLGNLRTCHVILVSWESPEDIIKRTPGNIILFTSGVSFLRLPEALETLNDRRKLELLAQETAEIETDHRLRAAIRADYSPPDSAHNISNWWGAWRLIQAVEGSDARMPPPVRQKISLLSGKQAVYLNPGPDVSKRHGLSRTSTKRLQELVAENTPTICYVDDEADQGWEQAFRTLLYGTRDPSHFKVISLGEGGARMSDLTKQILAESPNLLILDLRLAGNSEASVPPKKTTGALLLKEIRKHNRGLPILLMTASNKARTLQDVVRMGADAYWMKEGIGEHAPSHAVENPATELARLLEALLSENWQFLLRFSRAEQELRSAFRAAHCWWGHKQNWKVVPWGTTQRLASFYAPHETELNETDAERLFSIMSEITTLYREFLSLDLFAYSGKTRTEASGDLWRRGITVHAARVIEAIHRFDKIETLAKAQAPTLPPHISGLIRQRGDDLGQVLYHQRNAAAHYKPEHPFTDDETRRLLGLLCAWLRVDPRSYSLRLRHGEQRDPEDSLQEALAKYVTFDQSLIAKLSELMFAALPWKDESHCTQLLASPRLPEFRAKEGRWIGPEALMNIVNLEEGPRAALALQCLQPFAKQRRVQDALQKRWDDGKASRQLKCHLVWGIGDNPHLVAEFKTQMRSWILDNFGAWTLCVQGFFGSSPNEILESIRKKLYAGSGYPEYKKWIVICCLPISSDKREARRLLTSLSATDKVVEATRISVLERFFGESEEHQMARPADQRLV